MRNTYLTQTSRRFCRLLALVMLLTLVSGCIDDLPETTPTPTRRANTPSTDSNAVGAVGARPTRTPRPNAKAEWTVLVYLDGDNDLEESAIDDYNEMASVGSNEQLNIIVQFDRISADEDWDVRSNGNWSSVKRFRVEQGKRPTKSNQLADLGERNMGDPRTLIDFATWGMTTYPAQHYALVFWDHGASWPGVASDDSSDGDLLTLPEIATALTTVQQRTGVQKLDLIGFDACLMGQIDVLRTIAPFGQVAIGSADLEPGEGWAWNAWLSDLANRPPSDAVALAPSIVKSFMSFYEKEGDSSVTLSAFDLNKVEQLTNQLDQLAGAMIDNMAESYTLIAKARAHAAEYASGDTDISAIDLGYFADSLTAADLAAPIVKSARALGRTLKAARITHGYGADHPNTSGISVYFPWKKKNYNATYAKSSPFTTATRWNAFLQAFYKAGRGTTARTSVTKPKLSRPNVGPDTPLNLQSTIDGSDTAYVSYFVAALEPDNADALRFLTLDYIYPPGATLNGDIPAWNDGDTLRLTWKASSWYLSNGTDVIAVPFTPLDYGASTYAVDGTYIVQKTGKQLPVSVEFSVSQGRGTLQHVWSFDKDGSENPRPRELKPRSGDTFTPDILSYIPQGDDFEEHTTSGTPITFGDQPLIAFESTVPSGSYVIGLLVEDITGAISDQSTTVTVENPDGDALPSPPAADIAPQTGETSDMLRYYDEQFGFQIDYPRGWETSSPGDGKVIFDDPQNPDGAYLGIDAYLLETKPATANRAIIEELLNADREQPGFTLRQEPVTTQIAEHEALRVEYTYQDRDGATFHVIGIALSDTAQRTTYLITFDAPDASITADSALFERMLASYAIN